jgi:hypothetical protein
LEVEQIERKSWSKSHLLSSLPEKAFWCFFVDEQSRSGLVHLVFFPKDFTRKDGFND